jgi:phosphoribosylformylglycinamidine cyclo-ligase
VNSWPVPPIFRYLQELGSVPQEEMLRTFNMGIGLVLVVPAARYRRAAAVLAGLREKHYLIGEVVAPSPRSKVPGPGSVGRIDLGP